MEVSFSGAIFQITMPAGAREALISGKWDAIKELVDQQDMADAVALRLPYV
jgi:hypothetical protein